MEKSDGILLFTPESYEPEAVAAAREWFAATGRHAYTTGPLLPSGSKTAAVANEQKLSNESNEIVTFLDETLKTSGEKSLVYVSTVRTAHNSTYVHHPSRIDLVRIDAMAREDAGEDVGVP